MKRFVLILLSVFVLSACGGTKGASEPGTPAESAADQGDTAAGGEEDQGDAAAPADTIEEEGKADGNTGTGFDKRLQGRWKLVCGRSQTLEDVENPPYFYMASDQDLRGEIDIYEEDGGLFGDISKMGYESVSEAYHLPIELKHGALYNDCPNKDWYVTIANSRSSISYDVTLTSDDELMLYSETENATDEDVWTDISIETYVREGSEADKNSDDYRYFSKVEVSDVNGLLRSISSNTLITLKSGTYNISEADVSIGSSYVDLLVDNHAAVPIVNGVEIRGVSNLMLEAAGDVEICIDRPDYPVLSFYNSTNVNMSGLLCGHHVEPGSCGGSVIYSYNTEHMDIKDCRLYGSGTYALESTGAYDVTVSDCEIYECTYGVVSLQQSSGIHFDNCNIHDNSRFSMIEASNSYDVSFTSCRFLNNIAENDLVGGSPFVSIGEGDIYFKDCAFRGNKYASFCENMEMVRTENCDFNDIELGYG